ncbi:TetR/AcrR family transcriptional regulator [Mycobacterium heidelbergense]|uniref:TetR/AcrR family transcriptional regulator n=1 Tax=Mycobacterium heidelbergense TaxID=53376 RepID=UPI003CE8BEC4
MRTHGWSGAAPASDAEAIDRILAAAKRAIDKRGNEIRITDIARQLGITRQTVYRYFPSTDALLIATAISEAAPYLDALTKHLAKLHDPAQAVVEAIAHTLERLPEERYLGLLLLPGQRGAFAAGVTSDTALTFGRTMLERFAIDWNAVGITADKLDVLTEYMLRILQSLVIDPGRPPRRGPVLRHYLETWVTPVVLALESSNGPKRKSGKSTHD